MTERQELFNKCSKLQAKIDRYKYSFFLKFFIPKIQLELDECKKDLELLERWQGGLSQR